jgi:hypothetical protein
MAIETFSSETVSLFKGDSKARRKVGELTFLERVVLRRAHPRMVVFRLVGVIWATYFVWLNNWQAALVAVFAGGICGYLSVPQMDFKTMAESTLGKIALLHVQPLNLAVQVVGVFPLVYGLWFHDALTILVGISVIALGHLFGWSAVRDGL